MTITDTFFDRAVSNLLRTGVLLSAAVVLAGGICYMARHGHQVRDYHDFHGVGQEYRSLPAIAKGAFGGDCPAIIQLGLLILIATPVARVTFSLVAFALEEDRIYVAVTAIVLTILLYSLFAKH